MIAAVLVIRLYVGAAIPHGMPSAVAREAVDEATAIWRAAGVDIQTVSRADAAARTPDLYVYFTNTSRRARTETYRSGSLAWIAFVNGRPMSRVFASWTTAQRLLEIDGALRRRYALLSEAQRARLAGRVLGRALAHEIGHYLLTSANHAPHGLMRASHPIQALAGEETRAFAIATEDCSVWWLP